MFLLKEQIQNERLKPTASDASVQQLQTGKYWLEEILNNEKIKLIDDRESDDPNLELNENCDWQRKKIGLDREKWEKDLFEKFRIHAE